jgi:hypothetical protein
MLLGCVARVIEREPQEQRLGSGPWQQRPERFLASTNLFAELLDRQIVQVRM